MRRLTWPSPAIGAPLAVEKQLGVVELGVVDGHGDLVLPRCPDAEGEFALA